MNVYIDFETSGLPLDGLPCPFTETEKYNNCKILSVGLIHKNTEYYNCISDNEKYWNESSYKIHKLSKDEIKNGVTFEEFITFFTSIVTSRSIIVGYNIDFDVNVLCAELVSRNMSSFAKFVYELRRLCVMKSFMRYYYIPHKVKLTYCYHHVFKKEFNAHNALEDIKATKLLLKYLMEKNENKK